MDQRMMRDLEELQRYAGALGGVLTSVAEAARPSARGIDAQVLQLAVMQTALSSGQFSGTVKDGDSNWSLGG